MPATQTATATQTDDHAIADSHLFHKRNSINAFFASFPHQDLSAIAKLRALLEDTINSSVPSDETPDAWENVKEKVSGEGDVSHKMSNAHSKRDGKNDPQSCLAESWQAELHPSLANMQSDYVDSDSSAHNTFDINFKDPTSSTPGFKFLVESLNGYYDDVEYKAKDHTNEESSDDADAVHFTTAASQLSPVFPIFRETPSTNALIEVVKAALAEEYLVIASLVKFAESNSLPPASSAVPLHKPPTRLDNFTFYMMSALADGKSITVLPTPNSQTVTRQSDLEAAKGYRSSTGDIGLISMVRIKKHPSS